MPLVALPTGASSEPQHNKKLSLLLLFAVRFGSSGTSYAGRDAWCGVQGMSRVACEWKPARKGLTRVWHWWLERDSRQGWVQHMLSWPKGSLRTNGRRMPSSGATLTSKLGSICRCRSLCLHFSFGFPSRLPSFCPSYCCFGIFLHSNHFKEAARLLLLPCNSFCWLPISTSEAERKEASNSSRRAGASESRDSSNSRINRLKDTRIWRAVRQDKLERVVREIEQERERERERVEVWCRQAYTDTAQLTSLPAPFWVSRLLPGLSLQIQIETQTRAHVPQWTRVCPSQRQLVATRSSSCGRGPQPEDLQNLRNIDGGQ